MTIQWLKINDTWERLGVQGSDGTWTVTPEEDSFFKNEATFYGIQVAIEDENPAIRERRIEEERRQARLERERDSRRSISNEWTRVLTNGNTQTPHNFSQYTFDLESYSNFMPIINNLRIR